MKCFYHDLNIWDSLLGHMKQCYDVLKLRCDASAFTSICHCLLDQYYLLYLGNYPSGYSGAYGEFFNTGESIDEFNPRTLYVGNLDATISEEFLLSLFSHIGGVSKCKIIHEGITEGWKNTANDFLTRLTASDPYAFVEFVDHASAVQALTAMNKRLLLGKFSISCCGKYLIFLVCACIYGGGIGVNSLKKRYAKLKS
ncbi:nucleolysin TIAR [Trichinella spiralis]|uniref:nucleolysin TIAR n=1 Tax=Trichinella spiralis TaxID=6334 RepID=UPI0001EFD066|nr:nucleolysin TIAR [Trichinella spiralis]